MVWVAGEPEPRIIESSGRVLTASDCIQQLDSRDLLERCVAICYSRELGDDRAVLPLLKVLDSRDRQTRQDAIRAIKEIAHGMNRLRFFGNPFTLGRNTWRPQPSSPEAERAFEVAVDRLISILQTDHPWVRSSAAEALGFIGDTRAVKPLIKALSHKDDGLRESAAFALGRLGRLGDLRVVEPLIKALNDKHELVRHRAISWLGVVKDKRAVLPLIGILTDTSRGDYERESAADALGRLGDSRALPALLDVLRTNESMLGSSAGRAIGDIDDTSVVPTLIDILRDKGSPGRGYAAWALGDLGDERAVEPLIEIVKNEIGEPVRWRALQGLAKLKDKRAYDIALACVHDEDATVRACAAQALGALGDTRAVEPLIEAISDPDAGVRDDVIYALARLGDPRALEPLVDTLLHDSDEALRLYAAEALGLLGDARAIPAFEYALQHDEGAPEELPDTVRDTAQEAITKLREKISQPEPLD